MPCVQAPVNVPFSADAMSFLNASIQTQQTRNSYFRLDSVAASIPVSIHSAGLSFGSKSSCLGELGEWGELGGPENGVNRTTLSGNKGLKKPKGRRGCEVGG